MTDQRQLAARFAARRDAHATVAMSGARREEAVRALGARPVRHHRSGALPWAQAADVLEVLGDVGEEQRAAAYDLGGTPAALLS